jgi:hypothetical protein
MPHSYDSRSEDKCTAHMLVVLFWVICLISSKPAIYVHVSRHNEAFVLSVDYCLYFLLREFHFLCYQPLCPFSVLLAIVPVFCVISHSVRVRVLFQPSYPCPCSVLPAIAFVFMFDVLCCVFQPSCSCACPV